MSAYSMNRRGRCRSVILISWTARLVGIVAISASMAVVFLHVKNSLNVFPKVLLATRQIMLAAVYEGFDYMRQMLYTFKMIHNF